MLGVSCGLLQFRPQCCNSDFGQHFAMYARYRYRPDCRALCGLLKGDDEGRADKVLTFMPRPPVLYSSRISVSNCLPGGRAYTAIQASWLHPKASIADPLLRRRVALLTASFCRSSCATAGVAQWPRRASGKRGAGSHFSLSFRSVCGLLPATPCMAAQLLPCRRETPLLTSLQQALAIRMG